MTPDLHEDQEKEEGESEDEHTGGEVSGQDVSGPSLRPLDVAHGQRVLSVSATGGRRRGETAVVRAHRREDGYFLVAEVRLWVAVVADGDEERPEAVRTAAVEVVPDVEGG